MSDAEAAKQARLEARRAEGQLKLAFDAAQSGVYPEADRAPNAAHDKLADTLKTALAVGDRKLMHAVTTSVLKSLPHVQDLQKNMGMLLARKGHIVPADCFKNIKAFATGIWPQESKHYILNNVCDASSLTEKSGADDEEAARYLRLFQVHGVPKQYGDAAFACPDGQRRRLGVCALLGHTSCIRTHFVQFRSLFNNWDLLGMLYKRACFGGNQDTANFILSLLQRSGDTVARLSPMRPAPAPAAGQPEQPAKRKATPAAEAAKPATKQTRASKTPSSSGSAAAFLRDLPVSPSMVLELRQGYDRFQITNWAHDPAACWSAKFPGFCHDTKYALQDYLRGHKHRCAHMQRSGRAELDIDSSEANSSDDDSSSGLD